MPRLALAPLCLLALLCLGLAGCFEVRYGARQGLDLLQLMRSRRHVSDVIADPSTPPFVRQRLRLAMAARQFGIEVLGLNGGADFTRYVDTHGHLGYNLTVAEKTQLKLKTWLFGRVPYLGFLTRRTALATQARFDRQGYDTYLRDFNAFSGLGILLSPIYSDMISSPGEWGEIRTVETILHEMAHTSVWFFNASELNEPFATTVGRYGAALFFRLRAQQAGGPPPPRAAELARGSAGEAQNEKALSAWLRGAIREVRDFYQRAQEQHLREAEVLLGREEVFSRLMASYRKQFPGPRYKVLADGPLNNAVLLSFGVYLAPGAEKAAGRKQAQGTVRTSHLQEDLLASVQGDVAAYIALYRQAQARSDGPKWLRQVAADYRAATK